MAEDKREQDLTPKNDCAWIRGLDADGNSIKINKNDLAEVIKNQIGYIFMSYPIVEIEDCNPYIGYDKNGIYAVKESTLNRPPNSNHRAVLFNLSRGGYYSQIYFEITTGIRFFRFYTSAFSNWEKM